MADPKRRQALYDQIRQSSKDQVILEEMVRLGFWPTDEEQPRPADAVLQRQHELRNQLREQLARQRKLDDPEQAIKELRKERMRAARERRAETKVKLARRRFDKAAAWYERNQREITYLGAGVSAGLQPSDPDPQRLRRHELPELANGQGIAEGMGISLAELKFLSYSRRTSQVNHYQRFSIPKKTGGKRFISAPMPRLKRAQYWILDNILAKIPVHDAAHGFVPGRSIVSNATLHLRSDVVINEDLKDFFPSVSYRRVKGLFRSFGYSEETATVLGLLCTEPETMETELDGTTYYVARGQRHLPQGAPTSPAISNLLCRKLDARLKGSAAKLGFRYTRYADDMTFSGSGDSTKRNITKLLWRVRQIVGDEGFTLHPDKQRVMRAGQRQEVTGLVVNDQLAIARKTLRQFRALLHGIERHGPDGKHWGMSDDVLAAAQGFARYVAMVDPAKGKPLLVKVAQLRKQYDHAMPQEPIAALSKSKLRARAAVGSPPRDGWWQPELKTPPEKPPEPIEPSSTAAADAGWSEPEHVATPAVSRKPRFSWLRWVVIGVCIWVLLRLLRRLFSL